MITSRCDAAVSSRRLTRSCHNPFAVSIAVAYVDLLEPLTIPSPDVFCPDTFFPELP